MRMSLLISLVLLLASLLVDSAAGEEEGQATSSPRNTTSHLGSAGVDQAPPPAPMRGSHPLCAEAASDGRWTQPGKHRNNPNRKKAKGGWQGKLVCDGTLPHKPPQTVKDWQWSVEALELCGVHHFTTQYVGPVSLLKPLTPTPWSQGVATQL